MPRSIKTKPTKRIRISNDYARPITMAAILLGLVCLVLLISIQFRARDRGTTEDENMSGEQRAMELVPTDVQMDRPDSHIANSSNGTPKKEKRQTGAQVGLGPKFDRQYAAMLAKVRDQRRLGEVKEPYYYLLRKVRSMTNAELDSQVTSVTYADIAQDPNAVRGKVMRVVGTLMKLKPIHFRQPPPGVATIYEGHVVDSELRHYIIVLTDRPKMKLKVNQDVVRLNGVFFMVKAYKTAGGWWKAVPFVIGKRLVRVKRNEGGSMSLTMVMMLVAVVGATLLTIARVFWGVKGGASIRGSAGERRSSQRAKRKGGNGGANESGVE